MNRAITLRPIQSHFPKFFLAGLGICALDFSVRHLLDETRATTPWTSRHGCRSGRRASVPRLKPEQS
jgi:hypothetical protein